MIPLPHSLVLIPLLASAKKDPGIPETSPEKHLSIASPPWINSTKKGKILAKGGNTYGHS
jgi:hypothetical protein